MIGIALVHHVYILLPFLVDDVELGEEAGCLKSIDVFHSSFHELFQVQRRGIVVVVAENR